MPHEYTPTDIARFWSKVDMSGDCWMWTAAVNKRWGYGAFSIRGAVRRAHRIAWEIVNGPIPDDLHVCHACDNRACVNPAHLFIGTRADNMQDMIRKGRDPKPNARLTPEQIKVIRCRWTAGGITHTKLAAEYGVCRQAIGKIVNRMRWKHLD
jgi:hypothetical protein